jgi:hypothetical protein
LESTKRRRSPLARARIGWERGGSCDGSAPATPPERRASTISISRARLADRPRTHAASGIQEPSAGFTKQRASEATRTSPADYCFSGLRALVTASRAAGTSDGDARFAGREYRGQLKAGPCAGPTASPASRQHGVPTVARRAPSSGPRWALPCRPRKAGQGRVSPTCSSRRQIGSWVLGGPLQAAEDDVVDTLGLGSPVACRVELPEAG